MKATKQGTEHPGAILQSEFLKPMQLSQSALARHMGVRPHVISELVKGKRRVSVLMALRLSRALGTAPGYWMDIQTDFDLLHTAKSEQGKQILNSIPCLRTGLRG